jgi:hypothetical protein
MEGSKEEKPRERDGKEERRKGEGRRMRKPYIRGPIFIRPRKIFYGRKI